MEDSIGRTMAILLRRTLNQHINLLVTAYTFATIM